MYLAEFFDLRAKHQVKFEHSRFCKLSGLQMSKNVGFFEFLDDVLVGLRSEACIQILTSCFRFGV